MKFLPSSGIFVTLICSFFSQSHALSYGIGDININYDLIDFKEGYINVEYVLNGYEHEYIKEYTIKYSFKLINKDETSLEDLIADTINYLIIIHGIDVTTLGYYFENKLFPLLKEYDLNKDKFEDNELYKDYLELKMIRELRK